MINNKELEAEQLSEKVAFVEQTPDLFLDSLFFNITFNSEHKNISTAEEMRLEQVFALSGLPLSWLNDLGMKVGDSGDKLSGGQKQRIAIARALYSQKEIIILDEPTSALDEATSKNVFETLEQIKKEKIIILTSHRDKNKKEIDCVLELRD